MHGGRGGWIFDILIDIFEELSLFPANNSWFIEAVLTKSYEQGYLNF